MTRNVSFLIFTVLVSVGVVMFSIQFFTDISFMVIISNSMSPALNPHDLIIVKDVSFNELRPGDVIAFESHIENLGPIVHRVVIPLSNHDPLLDQTFSSDHVHGLKTQGDNVDHEDPWQVNEHGLIGEVYTIPMVGILLGEPLRYVTGAGIALIIMLTIFGNITKIRKKAPS